MADANVRGRILIGEKMYSRIALLATTFIATLSLSFSATAHVTLEQQSAIAGSTYKAVVRVPHGCGVSPTTSITVFLPDGFIGAKPMPKAGWNLSTTIEKLAVPFDSHGTMIETRPAVIKWSGGLLQDSEYDEFIFRVSLPAAPAIPHRLSPHSPPSRSMRRT